MTVQAWRSKELPKGMAMYSRWYTGKKQMSDIDGLVHNKANDRFVMVEFKPLGMQITTGQKITMTAFSKLPGCFGLLINDPYWFDQSEDPFEEHETMRVTIFIDGNSTMTRMTARDISQTIDSLLGIED